MYQPCSSAGRAGRAAAPLLVPVSSRLLPSLGERAAGEQFLQLGSGFLHTCPLGRIGSASGYKLYIVSYRNVKKLKSLHGCSGALGQECNEGHEQWCPVKRSFSLIEKESLPWKSQQRFGRAIANLFPSPLLVRDSPASGPWINGLSAAAICHLSMCLVWIQIASAFFPGLSPLLFLTMLFYPTWVTGPAPSSAWHLAAVEPAQPACSSPGDPPNHLLCSAPARRKSIHQASQSLPESSVTDGR